ncbi:MAG: hypothetical protein D8M59_07980 [Planctomycetes bacterium]|nr:hypothetical protein [Planctomycetota bacterium]NOG53261.1 hypothetical protein [Planctomycetota bacterium]
MDGPLQIFVIIGVLAIALVCGYFAWKAEQKRRQELSLLAAELGFDFSPHRDRRHDDEYAHFEIFRKGHSRSAFNTMRGTVEIDGNRYRVKMGDFTYKVTSGSGKSRSTRTYHFSYIILHLPFLDVPSLLIRPEGLFDKLAGAFGFDDIDFESSEFSKRFHVKSSDKRFAYDVITPRMMTFLLESMPATVDIEHSRCMLSDGRKRWKPAQFRAMLDWVVTFLDQWPDHVQSELGRTGSPASSR